LTIVKITDKRKLAKTIEDRTLNRGTHGLQSATTTLKVTLTSAKSRSCWHN